ncbi:MAG: HAD-IA family hydrolase [Pseudomonadota bacterium]|nr:HAD-IA family hydrolase [Pseudomonadota bacterium]
MQAYLFDFDGTLVDSAPDLTRALDRALERAGLPGVGLELGTQMVGHGAGALVEQAVRHITNDDSMTMKSPLCRLLLSVFLEEYEPICAETSVLYSGATELIETLNAKGKQVGLVTNKPRRFVELMLPAFRLQDAFDSIVAGDDLPTKKPEPDMVQKALVDLGRAPHEACLIGDSKADLGAAKAAGVTSILVSFGYAGDLDIYHCGADRVIHDLMELIVNDT